MDEKPKCSHTVDTAPTKQQPSENDQPESQEEPLILPEELTPAAKTQTLLIQPEELTPAAKTQTLLIQPEELTPAAKTQTLLILPEELTPAVKTQTLRLLPEELTPAAKTQTLLILPEDLTPAAKTQTLLIQPEELTPAAKTQTLLIQPEELIPAAKTQTLLILPKELTAAAKTQTVLFKELPASSEVETSPKTQPAFTIDQPIYLMEQNKFSKDQPQPRLSGDQPAFSKNQPVFSEAKPSHSKDQSKINYKDQPTFSKTQTVDKPALTASLTKIYIDSTKDESTSSRELIVAPKIQIDESEGESSLTKEQTTIIMTKCTVTSEACNINKDHFLSTNAPLKITSSTHCTKNNTPNSQFPATTTQSLPQTGQPLSLFLQALSKLNESSLALTVLPFRLQSSPNSSKICNVISGDITPPDSLTSAPPTYSFVLRQMAVRRRPRFMGTFFPSPSFVQHAPPPAYTGAFDVYIEPALPPPPARVYSFGFTSMPVVCQECGFMGMTLIKSRVTICTHLCAITLCLLCCWVCAPLPYVLSSCKDVYHYCRNCRTFLGMYCPTNPEAAYPSP